MLVPRAGERGSADDQAAQLVVYACKHRRSTHAVVNAMLRTGCREPRAPESTTTRWATSVPAQDAGVRSMEACSRWVARRSDSVCDDAVFSPRLAAWSARSCRAVRPGSRWGPTPRRGLWGRGERVCVPRRAAPVRDAVFGPERHQPGKVINLNKYRETKGEHRAEQLAETNRRLHGRTKS
jgi:hypothetical protein